MSSKSTLFLTDDNEHFYEECNEPHNEDGHFIGNTIVLEMSKDNIDIICNDKEDLILEIKPGSELYNFMMQMRE